MFQSKHRAHKSMLSWVGNIGAAAMLCATAFPTWAGDLKVGGIAFVKPTYEGSNRYEVLGVPLIQPAFSYGKSGRFSVGGPDDLRLRLFHRGGFEAGILGGYAFGRDEDDGPLLGGLGDVDGGVVAGAFVGYRIDTTLLGVSYHHIVSGDTGGFFRLGLTHKVEITPNMRVKARVGATYADGDYMAEYFGVTAAQSLSSTAGLTTYDTDAGFKDLFIKLSANYDISDRWSLLGNVGYKRLIGDAADSPVVETADQFSATLGLTYRFSFE